MSEFSQDQLYRLLEANEQQVHLLKKILRLLEGQTGRYQGDAPPIQKPMTFEQSVLAGKPDWDLS